MNSLVRRVSKLVCFSLLSFPMLTVAQQAQLDNWRPYDKSGINVFETPKDNNTSFDGLRLRIGAGFTQPFQSLSHENAGGVALYPRLAPGFAVAQANLFTDVQLADGILLNLTTYLSSRHHSESWVKGGYIQIDKIPFQGKFWESVSKIATVKMGHMEINYGDQHFRRSDGGQTLYNPFMENYIMDAFATEVAAEVYLKSNGLIGMLALSNGLINGGHQEPLMPGSTTETAKRSPSVYGKLAYDKQLQDKIRVRAAASMYYNKSDGRSTLYGGDRTGSNYWFVMESETATASANAFSGRLNPNFTNQIAAVQFNLFAKVHGLEVFGTVENSKGSTNAEEVANSGKRKATQLAGDVVYRLGKAENVFVGLRYNTVNGQFFARSTSESKVDRMAVGAGWFITDNILLKGEYVTQKYTDFPTGNILEGGKFNGVSFQAVVGF